MGSSPPSTPDFSAAVTAITSAFGDPTRRDIYLHVRDAELGATASAVAEHFELHPNVARHHLEKLLAGGYLEVSTDRSSTGAGRPSKRYRVTERTTGLEFAVRHDDLLVTLLGKTLARLPAGEAEALAEEVGAEYGRAMAATAAAAGRKVDDDAGRTFRAALHTVADALTAHGFAAHAESRDGRLRIISEHCPFGDAAIEHPVICAVDRGMVRGMLGALYGDASAATEASVARGDDVCVTAVE